MATEVESNILDYKGRLEEQLEKAKGSLGIVDNNLKKFIASNIHPPSPNSRPILKRLGNFDRPVEKWRNVKDNYEDDLRNNILRRRSARGFEKPVENGSVKRKLSDTRPKVVHSSINGPPKSTNYDSDDGDTPRRPALSSYVVAKPVVIPSRSEAISVKISRETRARDRRMFGALLGTLKKFKQEESRLKEKVDKKAQVEKKLEEAARQEKERIKEEKQKLIKARKDREAYIEAVEAHLQRVKDEEKWEETRKPLFNYIQTKEKPVIYYAPKIHNEKTEQQLQQSRQLISDEIEAQRNAIKQGVEEILERWNIDNLDQVPELSSMNPEPPPNRTPPPPPMENINAIPVKPQRSPIHVEHDEPFTIIKKEKEKSTAHELGHNVLQTAIGAVKIKVEKPDHVEHAEHEQSMPATISIKREPDVTDFEFDQTVQVMNGETEISNEVEQSAEEGAEVFNDDTHDLISTESFTEQGGGLPSKRDSKVITGSSDVQRSDNTIERTSDRRSDRSDERKRKDDPATRKRTRKDRRHSTSPSSNNTGSSDSDNSDRNHGKSKKSDRREKRRRYSTSSEESSR